LAQDDNLILLRFHASGALGRSGKIEIILDPSDITQSEEMEWAQQDAERIRMAIYGYLPDITLDFFEKIVLKRIATKTIIKELERRTS